MASVHGEFRFSALPMDHPPDSAKTGGRLTGYDMRRYMQEFSDKFLQDRIRFSTEVVKIERDETQELPWILHIRNQDGSEELLNYARVVLCTGVTLHFAL